MHEGFISNGIHRLIRSITRLAIVRSTLYIPYPYYGNFSFQNQSEGFVVLKSGIVGSEKSGVLVEGFL